MRFWREVDGLLLRQAADQAEHVRAAFIQSVPVDSIVNRWADSRTDGERISPQAARDWAHNNIQLPEKALKDALDHVYATGWVIGDDASTAAYAHAKLGLKKAAPTGPQISAAINTDWANWKPGNRPAAALVRPPNGLKKLLDKSGATVKEINGTTLDRVGTLLADSLNSGASYDSLARNLLRDTITSSVIKDSARAQMIAVTEMSRALNTSTVDNYGTFGVEKVEWLAIDTGTCEICPANEAQGPIPIGEMFESGDTEPPAHPNCRCTILPVVDEGAPVAGEAAPAEDFSTDEMEISDVADHAIEDVVAAEAEPSVADLPKLEDLFWRDGIYDVKDAFEDIYGSRDYNGFSVRTHSATTYVDTDGSKVIDFLGKVILPVDSREFDAGTVRRTFTEKPDGTRIVHHDLLSLKEKYRGKGFSTAFSKFSEDYYRANGIDEIEIYASLEDGSYTWAKAGYTWAESKPDKIMLHLENIINRDVEIPGVAPEVADEVISRLEKTLDTMTALHLSNERFPQPIELARFKGPDVEGVPFGRWLLHNTSWLGKKVL